MNFVLRVSGDFVVYKQIYDAFSRYNQIRLKNITSMIKILFMTKTTFGFEQFKKVLTFKC